MTTTLTSPELASRRRRCFADTLDWLFALLFFILPFLGILGVLYFLFRDALPFLDGRSLGKKALGIRAVKQGMLPPTEN
jgi:uncharacterized RDD family membrane protein YckC